MSLLKPIFLLNKTFYLLGGAVLIFALGFSWSWMIYLGFLLLVGAAVGVLYDIYKMRKLALQLSVKRIVPRHFSMFDENEVLLELDYQGDQKVALHLIDEIPVQFQDRDFGLDEIIQPRSPKTLAYRLTPLVRGEFHFGNINLFLKGSLGLIEFRKIVDAKDMVKVYPSFIQMQKFELQAFNSDRTDLGVRRVRRLGHGYEFSDIRQYVPGDDPRSINWKASSRSGVTMVNNYEDETSQQIYTVIDKSRVMRMPFEGLSLMDYAINASLAVLNIALKSKDNAGLIAFSKEVETFLKAQKRSNQLQLVMEKLYRESQSNYESNFSELNNFLRKEVRSRSLLLLFTNFMSLNSLKRSLPQLRRIAKNHVLVVIFFENTELGEYRELKVTDTLDMASKIMADKLYQDMEQVVYELRMAGIQAIQSTPEDLTTHTVNKYLELKARGVI